VRCLLGNLWITEERNHEDKIIGNAESFVLDRHGLSLITALGGPAGGRSHSILRPSDRRSSSYVLIEKAVAELQ
jgi:hypothetical protein